MKRPAIALFSLLVLGAPALQAALPPIVGSAPLPTLAPMIKRVSPAVVNIATRGTVHEHDAHNPLLDDPFLRRFFETPRTPDSHDHSFQSAGSGVIFDAHIGYILTNAHVVENATEITVTLQDGRDLPAEVIGSDAASDVAVLKVRPDGLAQIVLGDSSKSEVGDFVVAIGNPFGLQHTVTSGIISGLSRSGITPDGYEDFIQTDASINPGNSGGALVDTEGRLIGINTAIYSRTGTNAGIGFAIPVNLAKHVMDQLKSHGRVVRGWLGVEIQEVTPDLAQSFGLAKPEGALVASIDKDGPAAKSGLERGDVVLKFDGRDVRDEHELPVLVADTPINKKVPVEIVRNGKHLTLEVTVGELKEAPVQTAKAEEPGTNWGMQVGDITPEIASQFHLDIQKGVVVRHVAPDSPAADAGIQPGDLILEVDHDKVASVNDFLAKAKAAKTGSKSALLLVERGGTTIYMVIKAGKG
jgi:Do/DeqQ family serine protease